MLRDYLMYPLSYVAQCIAYGHYWCSAEKKKAMGITGVLLKKINKPLPRDTKRWSCSVIK